MVTVEAMKMSFIEMVAFILQVFVLIMFVGAIVYVVVALLVQRRCARADRRRQAALTTIASDHLRAERERRAEPLQSTVSDEWETVAPRKDTSMMFEAETSLPEMMPWRRRG
ncbi:hypothetical protein A3I45_03020 [Candidatus Uhrbacteria bacterium RIFCSPLOWO2_02_FULL_53_10]|uniref:Uncharacterized protein n=1 Tax=Candidatus Uhrbacteria bacterium RIFCSPLOWO2_02_FULL_53_10 TaxID=1802411 RepID=A0A1F7VHP2_9BACT|nr:MAG: hypothetical protein A3I45_03020 [Candidatus Uhrbacteria bacterium RIFCSPLOWO2_02_FULL_53_10]